MYNCKIGYSGISDCVVELEGHRIDISVTSTIVNTIK